MEELSLDREAVYTVSQITRELKSLLESSYASIWVSGEISNFHAHSSGHYYFTLKDESAQLGAVMFRGANRSLKFKLENGLEIIAQGRLSLYEPRGNYQLVIERAEPKGLGALQLAFTQLRDRLAKEGLFDEERKRTIPYFPQTVGMITSPTGAVLRDIVRVLRRRNPQVNLLLYPVSVQGEAAAPEIVRAIEAMNRYGEVDTLIVGRGGGSLEDLWAFNTEAVARAIFASDIPIISAVGHETDFSIADYVADLRAPTPSAAAELAAPVAAELRSTVTERKVQLWRAWKRSQESRREKLKFWLSHLPHPQRRLEEMAQRLDVAREDLLQAGQRGLEERRLRLTHLSEKLEVLSPLSILSRGYSIVRKLDSSGVETEVVKAEKQVKSGDWIAVQLKEGKLKAKVQP